MVELAGCRLWVCVCTCARVCVSGGARAQPIMKLIEESSCLHELMRHVDTGWASRSWRFKSSSAAGKLWQTAGHQSHGRQIVAVRYGRTHGSSESRCWVMPHVATSLTASPMCLKNGLAWKSSMLIRQIHLSEHNHFFYTCALTWRACVIFFCCWPEVVVVCRYEKNQSHASNLVHHFTAA